jgi:hypothetical protein
MIRIQLTISSALLASILWLDAGWAQAERSTIVGNTGTYRSPVPRL